MSLLNPLSVIGGLVLAAVIAFLLFQPNDFVRWLQKKNYQYEVTFSLYMLTPTEKFVFSAYPPTLMALAHQLTTSADSILFLTVSMFAIACCLYLPNHVAIMSTRAYYYFAGEAALLEASRSAASQLQGQASKASGAVLDAATNLAEAAYRATVNTAAAAQEVVNQAAENLGWD